jgi:hypothetical protein
MNTGSGSALHRSRWPRGQPASPRPKEHLADGVIAWQRVAGYWRNSGTLAMLGSIGAPAAAPRWATRYADSDCRAFLIDNPWSAAFISWVMVQSGVPGFNARHATSTTSVPRTRAALGPYGWSTRPPASRPHRATCCASCAAAHAQLQRAGAGTGRWRWAGNRIAK